MTPWFIVAIAVPLIAAVFKNTYVCFSINRNKNRINIGAALVFAILFAFRAFRNYTVGGDLLTYRVLFYRISGYSWEQTMASQGYEPGFLVYNKVLTILGDYLNLNNSFQLILIVTSIIFTVALVYFIYDNSIDPAISLFIYITFIFLGATFNNERQAIAIALLFLSYKYIKERNIYKFLILVGLAILFHNTSVAFIPLYFAYDIKITKKYWLCVIAGWIATFALAPILLDVATSVYFTKYVGVANRFAGSGYTYLLLLVIIVGSTFIFINSEERERSDIRLMIHMLVLSIFIQILALQISFIYRATRLFSVAMIFYFPIVFKKIKNSYILVAVFFAVMFAYFYIYLRANDLALIPYMWCWE